MERLGIYKVRVVNGEHLIRVPVEAVGEYALYSDEMQRTLEFRKVEQ